MVSRSIRLTSAWWDFRDAPGLVPLASRDHRVDGVPVGGAGKLGVGLAAVGDLGVVEGAVGSDPGRVRRGEGGIGALDG